MKRAGFTMIELIFVIVILGILASVAVPKLIGVKESADEGLIKGFVGTLNRTVAPAKWSSSLMNGDNGSVNDTNNSTGTVYDITTNILLQMDVCISPKVISKNRFDQLCKEGTSFIHNVSRDAITV